MKKKFLFGLLLGLAFGVCISIGTYILTVGEVSWEKYLEEKLIPTVMSAGSALAITWFGVKPVVQKVLLATSLFNKATDGVNTTAKNGVETKESIEAFKFEISKRLDDTVNYVVSKTQEQEERNKNIERLAINTQEILRIGFGNTEELVVKGYAAEIAKVGAENEEVET